MRTACLIGNGISMAYNPALSVPNLTAELVSHLGLLAGGDAEVALASFAHEVADAPDGQFERLLGPLSWSATALGYLGSLAPIAEFAPEEHISDGIESTSTFLRSLHRRGLGTVLGLIASYTIGHAAAFHRVTETVADALIALGPPGDLTLATLNYDGLTHAGLMGEGADVFGGSDFMIADLASGLQSTNQKAIASQGVLPAHWLRANDDIPGDRAALLHLHGYLGWLREPASGRVAKFTLADLRSVAYWERFAAGEDAWEPVVVLTDRKARATLEWPYRLAYQSLLARLVAAGRWLVAGYGLGDAPVNDLYRTAIRIRLRSGLEPPRVLVVTRDTASHPRVVARYRRKLGLLVPPSVTTVGIPEAFATAEWEAFAAS